MELLELYALTGIDNVDFRKLQLDEFVQKEFTVKTYEAFQQLTDKWIEFNGVYNPDYDEGLYIDDFALPAGLQQEKEAVSVNSKELSQVEPYALFTYLEEERAYLFFKVPGNKILKSNVYQNILSKETMQKIFPPVVNIKGKIACVYKDDTLYFTSYYDARQIFNLQPYYEAAVKNEIAKMNKQPYFNKEDEIQWSENLDAILNGNADGCEHKHIAEKRKDAVNHNDDKSGSANQTECPQSSADNKTGNENDH